MPQDAYPVPPASNEVLGIRAQNAVIGATADGTSIIVYASDGATAVYALDAGQKIDVAAGANTAQGAGAAIRVVANQPIAAVQYDDGDGVDASAFWPVSALTSRYALPVNAQYAAVACLASSVTVTLFKGSTAPETQTCSANGSDPGKVYFGATASGNNIPAGWYLHASAPVYVMYEAATPEDEHNLSGVQTAAGPIAPTLNTITTPTTSNPVAVTGTADANAVVRLYMNGRLRQVTNASGDGSFSFDAALFDGNNVIHAVAVNGAAESTPSNILQVVYNNSIPRTQSGTISGNVVWTPGNPATPYVVSAAMTVAAGANLTLQPGTTLRFNNGTSLTINGRLSIAGTAEAPVLLTSNAASPSRGNWGGVVFNATAAGSEIANAEIVWAATGVRVNGVAVSIRNSIIRNFPSSSGTGVWVVGSGASGTQIVGNQIRAVNNEGRCIFLDNASPSIINNTLMDCDRAVYAWGASAPSITGNLITSNDNGVVFDAANVASPQPVVTGNQFVSNTQTNFIVQNYLPGAENLKLSADGNWWGTTDIRAIAASISDWSDNPSSATVSTKLPSVDFGLRLDAADGVLIQGNYLVGPLQDASTTLIAGVTYDAIGVVQVPTGKTLNMQPGARLNFYTSNNSLLVDGTLNVQGADGNPAHITSGRTSPTRTDWTGIYVRAGGSAFIEYATIEWAAYSIRTVEPITVRYSTIRNFTSVAGTGIWVTGAAASGTQIIGNTIRGVSREGRCIFAEDSSPTITNNLLTVCDRGVVVYRSSPSINGNTFTANDRGVSVDGGGTTTPLPVVTGNQFFGNNEWNYVALANFAQGAQNVKLNATGNWWGTTDLRAISASISDWSDNPSSTTTPSVDFSGPLNAADGTPIAGNYLLGPLPTASTTLVSGSTYDVVGTLQVPAGTSLIVQAGARLNFHAANGALLVDGTLTVQGVEGNLAQLVSGRATPTRTDWPGIQVRSGGNALIEYALIEWAYTGIKTAGVPIIVRYSTIRNFTSGDGSGIWVSGSGASDTQIVGNTIRGVNDEGRCIYAEDSSPTISNNTLTDCDVGVSVYRASAPTITGNIMTSNDNGMYVHGGGTGSAQPVATGNQVFANDLWNYWATGFAVGAQNLKLNATSNWWGSTDPVAISASISDLTNDTTLTTVPTVDYSGYLDGPGGVPVPGYQLSGALTATSTVLIAGATYDVLSALVVPSANTLTIPPGTVLRFFEPTAALIVDGTLQIQGSTSSRVRLISAQTPRVAGGWKGIVVRATATPVVIDNAEIESTVRAIEVQTATVTVSNSLLHRFSTAGIAMTGSGTASQVLNNVIDNYTKVGDGIALVSSSPAVTGNRIARTNRAIYMSGVSRPVVTGNVLTENNWGIYLFGNNSNNALDVPLPVINSNDIYANSTAQLEVNAYGPATSAVVDATNNWWGTPTPLAGRELKFSGGTVVSTLDFSNERLASINFDSQPPSAPSQLVALAVSGTTIQLNWTASTDDFGVIEYLIERCEGASCSNFTQVATSSTTSHSDGGLTPSTHYRYRVRARDANMLSDYSAVAGVTAALDSQAPTAPSALDAKSMSSTQIDLSWSTSTDDGSSVIYVVERCSGVGCGSFTEIATVATPKYRNTGLTAASSYTYRVRARDAAQNPSDYSNVDTAATSITGADCD